MSKQQQTGTQTISIDSGAMDDTLKKAGVLRADLIAGKFVYRTKTEVTDEKGTVTKKTTTTENKVLSDVVNPSTMAIMEKVKTSVPDGQYVLFAQKVIRKVQNKIRTSSE